MARGPDQAPVAARPQTDIHFLERAEEAGEGLLQMNGTPAGLAKIFRAELIAARDYCRAEGPVFVRSLSPGEVRLPVDPQRETHIFS